MTEGELFSFSNHDDDVTIIAVRLLQLHVTTTSKKSRASALFLRLSVYPLSNLSNHLLFSKLDHCCWTNKHSSNMSLAMLCEDRIRLSWS